MFQRMYKDEPDNWNEVNETEVRKRLEMKLFLLILILLAIAFQAIPVHADSWFAGHDTVTGSKANSHVTKARSDVFTEKLHNMQDLTQCQLTNNGEVVCKDICGGLSAPGTACSFE